MDGFRNASELGSCLAPREKCDCQAEKNQFRCELESRRVEKFERFSFHRFLLFMPILTEETFSEKDFSAIRRVMILLSDTPY